MASVVVGLTDALSLEPYSLAPIAPSMCRMMGVVSQGPVYYDLFEEFADLASKGMCPIGAPDERGHKDGWGPPVSRMVH